MRLKLTQRLVEGALKSAYDAHSDGYHLHRRFIKSVAKRINLPVPGHRVNDGVLSLDDYPVTHHQGEPLIEIYGEYMTMKKAERLALAILWVCESEEESF